MPAPRKETRGGRAYAFPLVGILFLLACYWLLAEWHEVPMLISGALSSVKQWPP
jgi:uncharacterized RDD family membrane protein YckC